MHLNKLLSDFWNGWQTEYLLELRDSHRYGGKTSDHNSVRPGDVVLVHDTAPRGFWKLARILELISGADGRVRGAILKVASPDKKTYTLKRPLQRLYPLELPDRSTSSDSIVEQSANETETQCAEGAGEARAVEQSSRPKRSAMKRALDNVRAITFHERDSDQD